jgi:hypothetical protein
MNTLQNTTFQIFCPSHKPDKQKKVIDHFKNIGFVCEAHDGTNYPSWAKLQNDCIEKCKADIFIYVSHKNLLSRADLTKMISMVNSGFGIVGLYDITTYAASMDFFRTVGLYDERYLQGGWEEIDLFWRCCEKNIGIYLNRESYYSGEPSTWVYKGFEHYKKKWIEPQPNSNDNTLEKLFDEERYDYKIGQFQNRKFLNWKDSYIRDYEDRNINYRDWKVMKKNSFFL